LTARHSEAAARKLEAMLLKALYLDGHPVAKDDFRALAVNGEGGIAEDDSAMTPVSAALLDAMDCLAWRSRRRANHDFLAARLAETRGLEVLRPSDRGTCPFSVYLLCRDGRMRDRLRENLIRRRVYPAVLWPLEDCVIPLPRESVELSRRVLSLHCDGRYDEADMERVAEAVAESLR
jgi:dTDP-4-amino-4,6-dideoxygalactose transaminase